MLTPHGRLPLAGPLEAFDAVMDAVGIFETCLRWEGAAQRLGSLGALRARAHRYVATCQMEGAAATAIRSSSSPSLRALKCPDSEVRPRIPGGASRWSSTWRAATSTA